MLQSRLIALAVGLGAATLLAGCGDGSGPIADNVVRPGITAIDDAKVIACDTNLKVLETAIEAYTLLNGEPPQTETDLVGEWIREPVDGWDVVGGQIVAADAQCGEVGVVPSNTDVPATAPATTIGQIVTDTEAPISVDQFVAMFTPDEIAGLGGQACVDELALIAVAGQQYAIDTGTEPATLQSLIDAGYLSDSPSLWTVVDDELVALEGSGCVLPDTIPDDPCVTEARTLQLALEAYRAMTNDTEAKPTVDTMVAEGLLREAPEGVYLVDGRVVPVIGGPCEAVDLGV